VCHRKSSDTIFPYGLNILSRAALKNNGNIKKDKNMHQIEEVPAMVVFKGL
jgi:hypothetical protein